ncbi:MAG: DUF4870 domain-containing protein [Phycisphaerales bacterium]
MPADATQFDAPPVNDRGRYFDPDVPDDEKTFGLLGHLSVLGHLIVPVVAIITPIVLYSMKKKEAPFAADHLREAINFQITLILYSVVLPIVVTIFGVLTLGIGLLLLIPVAFLPYILGLVGVIMASMAAQRGEYYRYPMTIRFLHEPARAA